MGCVQVNGFGWGMHFAERRYWERKLDTENESRSPVESIKLQAPFMSV